MKQIKPNTDWFKETITYQDLNGFADISGTILLQDMKSGTIFSEIIIRLMTRFNGPGVGMLYIDVTNEYGTSVLGRIYPVGFLTNDYTYYHILPIQAPTFKIAADKLYAKFLIADAVGMQHRGTIASRADVGGNLGGKYFEYATNSYIWYNTGSSVDPAPAGEWDSVIEVAIHSGDSAREVARQTWIKIFTTTDLQVTWDGNTKLLFYYGFLTFNVRTSGFTAVTESAAQAVSANMTALTAGEIDIFIRFTQIFD